MRWIDIIRFSLTILRTNFLRTLLTIAAIGTAIGLIVVLLGFGYGVQDLTIGSIIHSQSLLSLDVTAGKDNHPPLDPKSLTDFKGYAQVKELSPVVAGEGQISYNGKLISNLAEAGTSNLLTMEGTVIEKGRNFDDNSPEIVLSPQSLSILDVTASDILDKTLDVSFINPANQEKISFPKQFKVVGITSDANPVMYLPHSMLPASVAMTSVKVLAKDRNGVAELQQLLLNQGYGVESLLDTLDSAQKVFNWATFGLIAIAAIALIVAAIGMFNTLTITLMERTREIGIMKSVGVTDMAVLKLFLTEAGIIGLSGGVFGILLGLGVSLIINQVINQVAIRYGGSSLMIFSFPP